MTIDIFRKYSHEINNIQNLLHDLKCGRIYEIDKTPGTPTCHKLSEDIEERFISLLEKIQNNDDSISEMLAKALKVKR